MTERFVCSIHRPICSPNVVASPRRNSSPFELTIPFVRARSAKIAGSKQSLLFRLLTLSCRPNSRSQTKTPASNQDGRSLAALVHAHRDRGSQLRHRVKHHFRIKRRGLPDGHDTGATKTSDWAGTNTTGSSSFVSSEILSIARRRRSFRH